MRNKKIVFMIAFVVIFAGITAAVGAVTHALADLQPNYVATQSGTVTGPGGQTFKRVHLTLDTFPSYPSQAWLTEHNYHFMRVNGIPVINPHLDWVTYGPGNQLFVPAYSLVTITINNYDGGISLLNDFYSNVRGTINNEMTVNGHVLTHISPTLVSHTFTIHGIPSNIQPWLFVSVPLLQVPATPESAGTDNGFPPTPNVIQFSFYVYGPGHYVWQCEYPCGTEFDGFGGPMMIHGYMNGTFTVTG